jgi:DNA-directed RNA polymerase specialized sigma24 family protein
MPHGLEEQLYDTYAHRIYAYCRALLGDDAADAVQDVFATAVRQGLPRGGETAMWLYGLARTECERRSPLAGPRPADPLIRAAAGLRSEQRAALLLAAGGWLEIPEIARLLGLAPDTVRELVRTGRTRLERGVLDALMSAAGRPEHEDLIAAFETGTLAELYARRTGTAPPAALRAAVLAPRPDVRLVSDTEAAWGAMGSSATDPLPAPTPLPAPAPLPLAAPIPPAAPLPLAAPIPLTAPGPDDPAEVPITLVTIGPPTASARARRRRRIVGVAGLAACTVVAAGLVAAATVSGDGIVTTGRELLSPSAAHDTDRQAPATTDRTGVTRLRSSATRSATSTAGPLSSSALATPPGVLPQPPAAAGTTPAHPAAPTTTTPTPSTPATSPPSPSTSPTTSPTDSPTTTPTPTDTTSPIPSATP